VNTPIIYEFPLNERIRVFIRLEQLFQQFNHHLHGENIASKRAAITVLFDIVAIFKRNDLKSEILKELDRYTNALNKTPEKSNKNTAQLVEISQKLYATTGKIGNHLIENELFQSIAQRSSIPSGTCSFDLPEFHYWLTQNNETCLRDLNYWSQPFIDIGVAIDLILGLIRNNCAVTKEIAPDGFFQITLNTGLSYQLLSVSVDKEQPYFAEISGGKHRCTIRFMRPSHNSQRPLQSTENIPFTLTRCIF
jgi:cell division protein ZapD